MLKSKNKKNVNHLNPEKKSKKKNLTRKKYNKINRVSLKNPLYLNISPDKYFILCDGRTIKDYIELVNTLETISDDIFYYHVNYERNDFANWINDVFQDYELAEKIRNVKSKNEMLLVLYKYLFYKLNNILK